MTALHIATVARAALLGATLVGTACTTSSSSSLDGGPADAAPTASHAPCVEQPGLPRPPDNGGLPCELMPPR